jgi:hypothetical protein
VPCDDYLVLAAFDDATAVPPLGLDRASSLNRRANLHARVDIRVGKGATSAPVQDSHSATVERGVFAMTIKRASASGSSSVELNALRTAAAES